MLAPTRAAWIPPSSFVLDASRGDRAFKHIRQGNRRLWELYSRGEEWRDEGMALVAQLLLMAECDAFVGSFASNLAVLVHDLQLARRVTERRELQVVEVDGRVYCGCGAKACMQLEAAATQRPRTPYRALLNDPTFVAVSIAVDASDTAPPPATALRSRALLPAGVEQ